MRPARYFLIPVIAITILTVSQATHGQYRDSLGTPWTNPISATMSTMIWNKINEMTMYGAANKRSGANSRSRTTTQTKPDVVPAYRLYPPVKFKPTGTRLTLQAFADELGATAQEKAE